MANANARASTRPVELAPVQAVTDTWKTTLARDPFDVSLEEKTSFLLALWNKARAVKGAAHGDCSLTSGDEWKIFASTDGSRIEQRNHPRVEPGFTVTAVDATSGEFESVRSDVGAMQAGWEYVTRSPLRSDARRIAEDAVRKLSAPRSPPGNATHPRTHEPLARRSTRSCGHSTELDRALGYEADLAARRSRRPKARQASSRLADRQRVRRQDHPGASPRAATTTRGADAALGPRQGRRLRRVPDDARAGRVDRREGSRGTSYAQDFESFPFQRCRTCRSRRAEKEVTLEDIVGRDRRRHLRDGRRLVVDRPPALQLPVRRPRWPTR